MAHPFWHGCGTGLVARPIGHDHGTERLLEKYGQVVENRLSPGHGAFDPSLSGRPCQPPLWSGLVVRLMASEQEHCQVVLDS